MFHVTCMYNGGDNMHTISKVFDIVSTVLVAPEYAVKNR